MTDDKRAPLKGNLNHEVTANDIYAALRASGLEFEWEAIPSLGFFPDRGFRAFGKQFYIENHTGTQSVEKDIPEKVEQYISYSVEHKERFHVLFIVHDYTRQNPRPATTKAEDTADAILNILDQYNRGNQFAVALFRQFTFEPQFPPLFECFVFPTSETILALETI